MPSIREDIAALIDKVEIIETTTARQFAAEAGLQLSVITNHRPHRVDHAELVGFISNTVMGCFDVITPAALADAIVDRFNLDEES